MRTAGILSMFYVLAILTCASTLTQASQITFDFSGRVTLINGPLASSFLVGDTVLGSYTFEQNVSDIDPSPNIGRYDNNLNYLSVEFLTAGHSFSFAGGPWGPDVSVFNDVDGGTYVTDQVFFYATTPLATEVVNGELVTAMEVDFMEFVYKPGISSMLTSDGLPLLPLAFPEGVVFLQTASGWTSIRLAPVPEPVTLLLLGLGAVIIKRK
jgi:hypothetical protein